MVKKYKKITALIMSVMLMLQPVSAANNSNDFDDENSGNVAVVNLDTEESDGDEGESLSTHDHENGEVCPDCDDGNPVPRYVSEYENDQSSVSDNDYSGNSQLNGESDGEFPETENDFEIVEEKYGVDSIVANAEAEQEYRASVNYVENKLIFSVKDVRPEGAEEDGSDIVRLDDESDLCKEYGLTDVTFVLETALPGYDDCDEKGYECFYEATITTEEEQDVWTYVDMFKHEEAVLSAEPDIIWAKTDQGDMQVMSEAQGEEISAAGWSFEEMGIQSIWNSLTHSPRPGEGVVVAVIDTGVDYTHRDIKNNMWINDDEIPDNGIDDDGDGYVDDIYGINLIENTGDPMDDMGHGTHVAGIIAMTAGNGGGVGIAYGSKIMAIKAGQSNGSFASTDIAKAIQFAAANGADVINMSFGGTGRSNLVEAALADAFGSCVLVASAGNDGLPTTDAVPYWPFVEDIYPADYSYVLGVMASDNYGNLASFSNWDYKEYANCEYEMSAPGVNIYSILPGNRYAYWSGTSMAAPMVSAAAAIVRREYSDKSKYTSRFIMGQLSAASDDYVNFVAPKGDYHSYHLLNIHDSLTKTPEPALSVSDISFFDSTDLSDENNGDGVIQAGETLDIAYVIRNQWGIADDVVVTVDADSVSGIPNKYVEFITDRIEMGNVGTFATINNGYIYDDGMIVGVNNPIKLKISENAPNDWQVTLNIHVTAKNGMNDKDNKVYSFVGTYTFTVQKGEYLRGTITEDMTLTADKLWIVDRPVLIPEGVTVNVDPGVQIQFYSKEEGIYAEEHETYIKVAGNMNIIGEEKNPVNIFPDEKYLFYEVNIRQVDNGIIDVDYMTIINPYISINNGNHIRFYQDTIHMLLYNKIYDGNFSVGSRGGEYIACERLYNSFLYKIGDLDSRSYSASLKAKSDINCLLIQNCYFDFEYRSVSGNTNIVFKDNYINGWQGISKMLLNKYDIPFHNNAVLNNLNKYETWSKLKIYNENEEIISNNYFGTNNVDLIRKMLIKDNVFSEFETSLSVLTLADDLSSIYPFVTECYVTDSAGEHRLDNVSGSQTVQIHVKFNRDMAQEDEYMPMVSFGPAEPYTDYVVKGDWVSMREWFGTIKIDPFINQGTMYFRIKDAAADDDHWLITGTDEARFAFDITKNSAEALTLQGVGGAGKNELNWVQDDYETLAGYNLYRATEYDKDTEIADQSWRFTKVNSSIIADDDKEFADTEVEQGQDYYYYFTVVDTQFKESEPSNIVKCRPLDTEAPVIENVNSSCSKTVGTSAVVTADVTDNVAVTSVTLYYKMEGEDSWKIADMKLMNDNHYQATVASYELSEGKLDYYIEAGDGTNVASAGSIEEPKIIMILAEGGNDSHVWDDGTVIKAANCMETGTMRYVCTVCGDYRDEDIPLADHTPETDEAVPATCLETGLTEGSHCSVCGEVLTKQEIVSFAAHTPETDEEVPASCTHTGLTEGSHCSVCGSVITPQEIIPAQGHSWDDGVVKREASCTEAGIKLYTCTECGVQKYKVIAPKGHTIVADEAVEASCTMPGHTAGSHCEKCDEVFAVPEYIMPKGHDWAEGVVTRPASYVADGLMTFVCRDCGGTKTVKISKLENVISVTEEPEDILVPENGKAVFEVKAECNAGTGLSYRWQVSKDGGVEWSNSALTGCKTSKLSFKAIASRNNYMFRCIITDVNDPDNKVISDVGILKVQLVEEEINIISQPQNVEAQEGSTVSFTVKAASTTGGALKYQWQAYTPLGGEWKNSGLAGNKTDTLTVSATAARDGYRFRCVLKNEDGSISVVSEEAVLSISNDVVLAITQQPVDVTATNGTVAKFSIKAVSPGSASLIYQWYVYDSATDTWKASGLTGNKTATLSVKATSGRNGYRFRCVVSDSAGESVTSDEVTLTVK